MGRSTRHLIVLVIFILISLYFILISLITLPYIQKNSFIGIGQNTSIDSSLNDYLNSRHTAVSTFMINRCASFDGLLNIVAQYKSTLSNSKASNDNLYITQLDTLTRKLNSYAGQQLKFMTGHNTQAKRYDNLIPYVDNTIKTYFMQVQTMGYSNLIEDFTARVKLWYPSFISGNEDILTQDLNNFTQFNTEEQKFTTDMIAALATAGNGGALLLPSIESLDNAAIKLSDAAPDLDVSPKDVTIPPSTTPGSDWGIFGMLGGWLMRPHSIDLVLIFGMLGFGLFGAASSMFVKNKLFENDNNISVAENVTMTIIKGFSAAIVVFLATKGGIALINTGSNDPNPYILFFSCLVGSVFSDEIWAWAKTSLFKSKSDKDDNTDANEEAKPA